MVNMMYTIENFNILCKQGRWKAEFFLLTDTENDKDRLASENLVPIRSLVTERKETVDPSSLGNVEINYLGLENILSLTGELVEFSSRPAKSIKSRSKVFRTGDVLYGRLRPNLNKVWLACGDISEGICSTEFLVLVPVVDRIRPAVLRYLLSSQYIQRHALRLQTGTALPRMNLDDLLDIEVPVPTLEKQKKLEEKLLDDFRNLIALRAKLNEMPRRILEEFMQEVEG
jgi:restriction endonuclease S subunit